MVIKITTNMRIGGAVLNSPDGWIVEVAKASKGIPRL
jgi:hypothetical protein